MLRNWNRKSVNWKESGKEGEKEKNPKSTDRPVFKLTKTLGKVKTKKLGPEVGGCWKRGRTKRLGRALGPAVTGHGSRD